MGNSINSHAMSYFNLLKTASWIEIKIKKAIKPFNLTHAQLNVLSVLGKNHPKPMTVNAVKKGIIVANPDVTRLLDRLVKKELIERKTCNDNRRKVDITITSKGMDLLKIAQNEAKKAVDNFFENKISIKEAAYINKVLIKMRN